MFTKEELITIRLSLMKNLNSYKKEFEKTQELGLIEDIENMKKLIEKVMKIENED